MMARGRKAAERVPRLAQRARGEHLEPGAPAEHLVVQTRSVSLLSSTTQHRHAAAGRPPSWWRSPQRLP